MVRKEWNVIENLGKQNGYKILGYQIRISPHPANHSLIACNSIQ